MMRRLQATSSTDWRNRATLSTADNARDGLFLAGEPYDLIVVDRMLPRLDGIGIVKTIRSAGIKTLVLFLSTLDGIDDRVIGLDARADKFAELVARLPPVIIPVAIVLIVLGYVAFRAL